MARRPFACDPRSRDRSVSQMDRSRSISASSSAVPWTFGPVNHLRAETAHQMPANPMTTSTAMGAKLKVATVVPGAYCGQHQHDDDEDDPDDGDPVDDRPPRLAELPGSLDERAWVDAAQEHRCEVGDVEPDDRDGRHRVVGDHVPHVRGCENEGSDGTEPGRPHGHARALADMVPEVGERHGTVARERVDHARVRGDRRHAAEELSDDDDEDEQQTHRLAGGEDEDRRPRHDVDQRVAELRVARRTSTPEMVTGKVCGIAKLTATSRMKPATMEIQIELTMPLGAETRACDRLLGHVGRCVIPGERVLGVQEADEQRCTAGS